MGRETKARRKRARRLCSKQRMSVKKEREKVKSGQIFTRKKGTAKRMETRERARKREEIDR